MVLSWWGSGLWKIFMHHWTVHAKVEFPRFLPDVRTGGIHSTTFDAELRNVSFALISFMGFPAIISVLQPFQICIYNRKYSKLTFSNGFQLIRKRFMANLHASLGSTCKSRISKISTRCQNWRGWSSFTMSRQNLNWKILGEILVGQMGGTCPQTHIHHSDSISHALLGYAQLNIQIYVIWNQHIDHVHCSSPRYSNGGTT